MQHRQRWFRGAGILVLVASFCLLSRQPAKAYVEESKAGRYSIIVTELPFQVNKASLHEKIAELIHDDKLPGASLVRDESDRNGMRLVVELKRDAQPKKMLNLLFKHTAMQSTFGVNMVGLVNGNEPRVLTLKKSLQHYVDWQVIRDEVKGFKTYWDNIPLMQNVWLAGKR